MIELKKKTWAANVAQHDPNNPSVVGSHVGIIVIGAYDRQSAIREIEKTLKENQTYTQLQEYPDGLTDDHCVNVDQFIKIVRVDP